MIEDLNEEDRLVVGFCYLNIKKWKKYLQNTKTFSNEILGKTQVQ